jgi:hypothetical protein
MLDRKQQTLWGWILIVKDAQDGVGFSIEHHQRKVTVSLISQVNKVAVDHYYQMMGTYIVITAQKNGG